MKTPKEDPADKAARLRERRLAELDRSRTISQQASAETSDIRAVYGNQISMFGRTPTAKPTAKPAVTVDPFKAIFPGIPTITGVTATGKKADTSGFMDVVAKGKK